MTEPERLHEHLFSSPRISKLLTLLGLSRQELRIYLSVLSDKGVDARTISSRLNIVLPRVYSSLKKLETMGLVRRVGRGRPVVYQATDPEVAWGNLLKEVGKEIDDAGREIVGNLKLLAKRESMYRVVLLEEGEIERRMADILLAGVSPAAIAAPFPEMLTDDILGIIRLASSKRSIRLLTTSFLKDRVSGLKGLRNIEVRVKDDLFGGGIIGDEIMLIIKSGGDLVGLWSNHVFFVHIARVYFNHLWEQGDSVTGKAET